MLIDWFLRLYKYEKGIVLVITFFILTGIVKSGYYTLHYGGVDLRERIVGARMITIGKSPYFGRWSPGEPERFINPNIKQTRAINGVSVAPGTLYVLYPFSLLPYSLARILWMVFQYVLILYIFLYFLLSKETSDPGRLFIYVVGGLFFLCSSIWLLHIERGQVYILYAFLFCVLYQFYSVNKSRAYFFAGAIVVIAAYCRPSFIVVLAPMLFTLNKRLLIGFAACSVLLLIDVFMHFNWWSDYLAALASFTRLSAQATEVNYTIVRSFPEVIEGMNNLTLYKTDFSCGGITPLNTWLEKFVPVQSGYVYIGLYVFSVLLLLLLFRKKLQQKEAVSIILLGFLLYMLSEYIMPAPRGAYNLIQWIFPVLLLLQRNRMTPVLLVVMVTGLLLITGYPFTLPFFYQAGEALLFLCVAYCIYRQPKVQLQQK